MTKKLAVLVAVVLLGCCAPKERVATIAVQTEAEQKISQADSLRGKGCFVALKQAFNIYQDLSKQPKVRKLVASKLTEVCLLLSVREKELGISNKAYLDEALALIKENSTLGGYAVYSEIAGIFWVQGKGVMGDVDTRFDWQATQEKLKKADAGLRLRAKGSEFCAYMYAVLRCAFMPTYGISLYEQKDDLAVIWATLPESPLLKFKRAICPKENPDLLKEILAAEPQFYEANYFLGSASLAGGKLLEAEKYFLEALAGIPESSQITLSLATIAFATEELERSLDYYEKTLAVAPEFRDALLGKAICLSYLGRPAEAIAVCQKIIGLGYWLLGESYYWMAWNQHELKDNEAAAASIEQAKGRLPTSSEVFTLSGNLALERGDLAKAEKDLREALQYNPQHGEALMLLGSLYAQKNDWPNSGAYFEKAGSAYESEANGLKNKMAEIEKSELQPGRKDALLRKKAYQLEKVILTKATGYYDAAAGYSNSGQKPKAVAMAMRAALHPAFKQKAEDLLATLK
jgi:tetratricopeptide (TPR) repeat protein